VTRPFLALWGTTLLFYLGFQLLLPVVPLYAAALGAREAQVGLIMGIFALSAMVLRPVAGDLADRIGRRPLVLLGTAIFLIAPVGYALVGGIPALLVVRLFHGTGMGFGPTAATVVATDLTPAARRGAAMGLFGLASAVALAVGPFAGGELVRRVGFVPTFLAATGIEVLALGLAWTLPETRPAAAREGGVTALPATPRVAGTLARFWRRWFSTAAVYPSALVLSLYVSYGGLAALLPLFAERRGLGNPGLFYTVYALVSLAVRSPAGRLSDRAGRRIVIAPALAIAAASLAMLGFARTQGAFLAAAAFYGVGFGAAQPALLAMTADRAAPEERGRAMGTLYTAWELGISGGAILLGLSATTFGYTATWGMAAAIAALGALAALGPPRRARGGRAGWRP
jgi:MFS family permease